ncbi:3-phenylpropionate MFS transporter [Photorhabdus heterorhabditis]|uniref:3-phenylpropionate MFS transporter n=1 Tax=Photorhabdus heterorhabditis TaxID=880156 RepID=A0A5B0X4N0_9GAMM|nr:3-phenylpropionate MFS transporter [Photorhabdus heterorhabditis]KAA1193665.1 3-phenylpropionate MFS transporter [Photorhabdus heterorhabditis]KOY60499.1 3-phenylpropionic acid transporter [Photorhabdus heterorhabditis]MBS9441869.1 3-phenylpropionate MFS transporter [Photorhabdus heterorhabditis]
MVIQSTRWLALDYFTYFFSYGIFLPFWAIWLQGEGIEPDMIGILLGAGLVSRFLGSLLIAPTVKNPAKLIVALRILALLTLIFVVGFTLGNHWAWLLFVMIGFNLFFSPMMPLGDALAGTWQKQFPFDYGKIRVWGSIAFIISSALTGELISVWGHHAILITMLLSVLSTLLVTLLKPSIMPANEVKSDKINVVSFKQLLSEKPICQFLLCVALLQGAHAGYYSFSAIYWEKLGYSASVVGYLWSLGVVAEVVIFTLSNKLFRRWSARDLLLLSGICGVVRWGLMATFTALPVLIVVQILHCGTFTVCHLAAMRFIGARKEEEIVRLQAAYSALAMGGAIAVMTVVAGFMYDYLHSGIFWVMALVAFPAIFLRPQVKAHNY